VPGIIDNTTKDPNLIELLMDTKITITYNELPKPENVPKLKKLYVNYTGSRLPFYHHCIVYDLDMKPLYSMNYRSIILDLLCTSNIREKYLLYDLI
jgi:hypothetical protein